MHISTYIYMHIYTYICIFIYKYMYIYLCIVYIYWVTQKRGLKVNFYNPESETLCKMK